MMEQGFLIIIAIPIVIGLIFWIIKAAKLARERALARIAAMKAFADQKGFSFSEAKDANHDDEYAHFEIFRRGFDRYAYNTMRGYLQLDPELLNGAQVECVGGDFTYKTKETYTTTDSKGNTTTHTRIVTHHFSYFIVDLPFAKIPDVLIRKEGVFDKIAAAFGKNDIDFESAEFSRKFYVKCDHRKFAYDIINQRMIEFLLETKPGLIDMEQGRICLTDGYSAWPEEKFGQSLEWVLEFLGHWPDFVIEDLEKGLIV